MTQPDPRAAVLRTAGHSDAADLLESLNALEQPAPQTTTDEAPTPPTQAMTAQQAREAEGQAVLEALYRSIPDLRPDAEPAR